MGVEYRAVQWNRQKRLYDAVLVSGVAVFLATFGVLTKLRYPRVTDEILLIRAFGTAAFLLLHVILCIGPLCRLNPKFLPLLYNRRHAGVTCFLLGLIHAALVILTYHAGSDTNPILSIFVSSPVTKSVAGVPFQPFGFFALVILFLMAATSHDFWLANLTAPVWKALHMLVYVAYALLVLHVTFGVLQGEGSPVYVGAAGLGLVVVLGLHLTAARRERALDHAGGGRRESAHSEPGSQNGLSSAATDGFVDAGAVADIPENRARVVCLSGERVAIFKYDGIISAVSNVCQHQNGPLGEGKIVDGCITCPWHGYQYQPDTGAAPPPFVEKVPTFNVRVKEGRVFVHPKPNPAGTRAERALIEGGSHPAGAPSADGSSSTTGAHCRLNDEFYIGWEAKAARGIGKTVRNVVVVLLSFVALASVVLVVSQRMIGQSAFEWGMTRTFAGTLRTQPYPHLLVPRPGNTVGRPQFSTYHLVAPWKFGLNRAALAPLEGKSVALKGTLIYRGDQTMVETKPEWITVSANGAQRIDAPCQSLGRQTLVGEIVDSKCFLGVMNPGQLAPHRACAIRCISGGVPPVLLVRQKDGPARYLLLVSSADKPVNQQVLSMVAEPLEITGEVVRQGDLLILRADPATYRRMK